VLKRNIKQLTNDEMTRVLAHYGMTLTDLYTMLNVHEYDALTPVTLSERLRQRKLETFEELAQTESFRMHHIWQKNLPTEKEDEKVPSVIGLLVQSKTFPNGKTREVVVGIRNGREFWLDKETGLPVAQPVFE